MNPPTALKSRATAARATFADMELAGCSTLPAARKRGVLLTLPPLSALVFDRKEVPKGKNRGAVQLTNP
ncbi:hypothetical protein NDU88_001171 [Pleurodeles waltl]|uniref:Uncharacterized protein n=1 Tax=Pleurodeles waltl TaxID=8319 RepID=A0AAV7MLX1_PLEWA|nr:hypothetical protein NDU88_001171 [Pleurodeles waltl]